MEALLPAIAPRRVILFLLILSASSAVSLLSTNLILGKKKFLPVVLDEPTLDSIF